MSLISPDLTGIVDGQVGDAADWTTPFNTITNEFNGNISNDNISSTAGIEHGKLLGGARFSDRQNNTTNSTVTNQRVCMGWGYWVGDSTNSRFIDSITFPITYTDKPIVLISLLGGASSATPTDQGDFGDYNTQIVASNFLVACAEAASTTGFSATLRITTGSGSVFTSSESIGYSWIAIGTKAN